MAPTIAHGKCLCGTIEIQAERDFNASIACSCKNCQSCSGSSYSVNLVYPKDTVTVTKGLDHLKTYEDHDTDSGRVVQRRFCGRCGNAIFSEAEDGTCFVKAPIMEGGLETQPSCHLFTRNLPSWAQESKTGKQVQDSS